MTVEMRRCALSYEHVSHVCEPSGHDVNWPLLFVGGLYFGARLGERRGLSVVAATVPPEKRLLAAVPSLVFLCARRSTVGFVVILSGRVTRGLMGWRRERDIDACMHAFFFFVVVVVGCCCLLLEMCFAEEEQ